MDILGSDKEGLTSIGVVFFANELIRALDAYRESKHRPVHLGDLCDRAIVALNALHRPESAVVETSTGLMTTADEIATLASSLRRAFNPRSIDEANRVVERMQKSLGRVKEQKFFSPELRETVDDVLSFFQSVAEEGLANCRRHASGETTEAERIWQHYSMS